MKIINNSEELLEYGYKVLVEEEPLDNIKLGNEFKHHIKIKGSDWDGQVNYDIANIIIEYQKSIKKVYLLTQGFKPSLNELDREASKELEFKAKVEEGSSDILSNLPKILEVIANKMNSVELFWLFCFAIACYTGFKFYSKTLDNSKDQSSTEILLELQKLNNKNQSEVLEKIEKIVDQHSKVIEVAEQPNRTIFNKMKKGDELQFNDQEYTYEDLKNIIPKAERKKPEQFIVDDEYIVNEFKNYEGIGKKILLTKDDISFVALAALPDNELKQLWENINSLTPINLQVLATIKKHYIEEAIVTGVGEKRQGAVSIDQATAKN